LYKFAKKYPATYRGAAYFEMIHNFEERIKLLRQWVEESNKKYKSKVKVGAITLEAELFTVRKNDESWNESMRQALDAIHLKAQAVFPNARIEWFSRGIRQGATGDGWVKTPYWTGKEIKPSLSCSLYMLPEIEATRERFRRTCKLADEMGVEDVTPWVALGAGYRRGIDGTYWDSDWSYDIIYSYQFGSELNHRWYGDRPERFAPYNRAKVIIFYPPPFDKRVPDWGRHFIAYVRGATGVKKLNDLGYEE
jgi:hypothetical protein